MYERAECNHCMQRLYALTVCNDCVHTLQALLTGLEELVGPAAPMLTPPPAGPPDNKGVPQPSCPVLLLLDLGLADLPWESLPQLQQASAVAGDFSLHLQHSRTTAAASTQVSCVRGGPKNDALARLQPPIAILMAICR